MQSVRALAMVLAGAASIASVAHSAQWEVGAAGGVIEPYEGSSGPSFVGHFLVSPDQSPFRFGAEFEYRDYESEFFGVTGVDVESYQLRALLHYVFETEWVNPYLGVGLSASINIVDADEIEAARPGIDVFNEVGTGIGATGIVGLEVPVTEWLSVFGEARAGAELQLTNSDGIDAENLSGVQGLGGLRIAF